MKYFSLVLGLILFVSCAHVSTTSPPVNFTGKWKGAINERAVNLDFDFNFLCDGKTLTGTARDKINRPDKSLKIEHGEINGKNIFFIVDPGGTYAGLDVRYRFRGKYIGENRIELFLEVLLGGFKGQSGYPQSESVTFNVERVY